MNKSVAWLKHTAGALIGALIATGAIYELVPGAYHKQCYAIVMILAYLLGVKIPTPGVAKTESAHEERSLGDDPFHGHS